MDDLVRRLPNDISHIVDKIRGKSAENVSVLENELSVLSPKSTKQHVSATSSPSSKVLPAVSLKSSSPSSNNTHKLSNTKSIQAYSKSDKNSSLSSS